MLIGSDLYQANDVNPPETPAPVFAVKAFKHAIFGTPQTVPNNEKRPLARSLSKSRGYGKDTRLGNQTPRGQNSTDGTYGYTDENDKDTSNRNSVNDPNVSFTTRPLSPTKPNGILMTPGTGPVRRKTVSFGMHAPATERGLAVRPSFVASKGDTPKGIPGKFPSPWIPKVTNDNLPRPSSAGLQSGTADGRGFQVTATPFLNQRTIRAKDDGDITYDMETPRSESGKYWQARYMSYAEKSGHEMTKLLQKQQSAKQYAKKKDTEAMELLTKLKDERRRHRLRERALESQLKEHKEQLTQYEVERQSFAKQKAALKKRVEELQRQQQKQVQQFQRPTTTGHGLRRSHSSAGGRGSGSGLGSDERHSGTSTSAVAGNGSKTSSFASDSNRMSSSTMSHNKENEKHDSVLGKIFLGDVPKSPPGGVMKATEALAGLMEEAPQMSFLHPPSDTENVSPRGPRKRGSKSDLASKIPPTDGGQQEHDLPTRTEVKRSSHNSISSRPNYLATSRSKENATKITKDAASRTGTIQWTTDNTADSTRVRPVTAILRPRDNTKERAVSSSPDPWLISTSSPEAPLSLPVLQPPVISDRISSNNAVAEYDNDRARPGSPTLPSPAPQTRSPSRDRRRYNRSSSSSSSSSDGSSTNENMMNRNDDYDNRQPNVIDEEDPPSLHMPSPRLQRPAGKNIVENKAGALGGSDDSIKAASSSTLNTKSGSSSSGSSNSAKSGAQAATNDSYHDKPLIDKSDASSKSTDKDDDNIKSAESLINPSSNDSLTQQQQQQPSKPSSSSSSSDTRRNASVNHQHESKPPLKGNSKVASPLSSSSSSSTRVTVTPKSIPILIPLTPPTAIAPQTAAPAAVTKFSTSRSGTKTKRFLSSERAEAAWARVEMRRKNKGTSGKNV